MEKIKKYKEYIIYFIFSLLLGILVYKQFEITDLQKTLQTQVLYQKELIDNITRSSSQYTDKLDNIIKNNNINLNAIKNDIDKLDAKINSINIVTVNSNGYKKENQPSTSANIPNPNPIEQNDYGYMKFRQDYELYESFRDIKVPIGKVGFSAWSEKPWMIDLLPREYKLVSVLAFDENRRQYTYNKFSIKVNNKDYDLPISIAETKQEYPKSKFNFWNPRLFLTSGISFDIDKTNLSVNFGPTIGIMSYGKFKINPDISILQIGISYQTNIQQPSLIINPINFNIGNILPKGLVNNTYIGPSIQLDIGFNLFLGGNLSVGL